MRDLATKALQRYGQPEPERLFDLAARMLDVDDPYVVEGIVAGALHPAVPDGVDAFALRFAAVAPAEVMGDDDPNADECARTFGFDFENYIIGAAINGQR